MIRSEVKEEIHKYLIEETDFLKVKDSLNEDELRSFIDKAINELCRLRTIKITLEQRLGLMHNIISSIVSLGPIRSLIKDDSITEIMINGYDSIYIQKNGRMILTDIMFDDPRHLHHTVQKILVASGINRRFDESCPYVDFSLSDGSRVNAIMPPCVMGGKLIMTIRKFNKNINTIDDLVKLDMLGKDLATLLVGAMKAKLNVVFCGATGAGKTTALNVLSGYIPEGERIITIEDTAELRLQQKHVVSLISKPANIEGKGEISIGELFVNSLRMRPDRIIIGEVRGHEILDMIQSIASGHSGSLSIVHAESPKDCFDRMITLMLMTGIHLSTKEIQKQVARAIDLIVHIELFIDGKRRVTNVTTIFCNESTGKFFLHDIFRFEQKGMTGNNEIIGGWRMDKTTPKFISKFKKRKIILPESFFEEPEG